LFKVFKKVELVEGNVVSVAIAVVFHLTEIEVTVLSATRTPKEVIENTPAASGPAKSHVELDMNWL
jgi:predicted DNA-binding antitoxin AbrB/MazE fold protein